MEGNGKDKDNSVRVHNEQSYCPYSVCLWVSFMSNRLLISLSSIVTPLPAAQMQFKFEV